MLGGFYLRTKVSLKLCQKLCSFKWLKPKHSVLNLLKDSAFLILLSNLFHSLIQYGEKECLKPSVLDETVLRVSFCNDLILTGEEVRYVGESLFLFL